MARTHVENRRLFDSAFGRLKLKKWEQDHLHECEVCQGVLYVFVHQPVSMAPPTPQEPSDAA
jgi:hypothetical protein